MTAYFEDPGKLTYPDADELVERYIDVKGATRQRATCVDVLNWADAENSHHNRIRVHDALRAVCEQTDETWSGRAAFELPEPSDQ